MRNLLFCVPVFDCVIPNARAFVNERRDLPNHDCGAPACASLGGAAPFDFAQGRPFSAAILGIKSTQRADSLRESSRNLASGRGFSHMGGAQVQGAFTSC